jgi:hypothetical protein
MVAQKINDLKSKLGAAAREFGRDNEKMMEFSEDYSDAFEKFTGEETVSIGNTEVRPADEKVRKATEQAFASADMNNFQAVSGTQEDLEFVHGLANIPTSNVSLAVVRGTDQPTLRITASTGTGNAKQERTILVTESAQGRASGTFGNIVNTVLGQQAGSQLMEQYKYQSLAIPAAPTNLNQVITNAGVTASGIPDNVNVGLGADYGKQLYVNNTPVTPRMLNPGIFSNPNAAQYIADNPSAVNSAVRTLTPGIVSEAQKSGAQIDFSEAQNIAERLILNLAGNKEIKVSTPEMELVKKALNNPYIAMTNADLVQIAQSIKQ